MLVRGTKLPMPESLNAVMLARCIWVKPWLNVIIIKVSLAPGMVDQLELQNDMSYVS